MAKLASLEPLARILAITYSVRGLVGRRLGVFWLSLLFPTGGVGMSSGPILDLLLE